MHSPFPLQRFARTLSMPASSLAGTVAPAEIRDLTKSGPLFPFRCAMQLIRWHVVSLFPSRTNGPLQTDLNVPFASVLLPTTDSSSELAIH